MYALYKKILNENLSKFEKEIDSYGHLKSFLDSFVKTWDNFTVFAYIQVKIMGYLDRFYLKYPEHGDISLTETAMY